MGGRRLGPNSTAYVIWGGLPKLQRTCSIATKLGGQVRLLTEPSALCYSRCAAADAAAATHAACMLPLRPREQGHGCHQGEGLSFI